MRLRAGPLCVPHRPNRPIGPSALVFREASTPELAHRRCARAKTVPSGCRVGHLGGHCGRSPPAGTSLVLQLRAPCLEESGVRTKMAGLDGAVNEVHRRAETISFYWPTPGLFTPATPAR